MLNGTVQRVCKTLNGTVQMGMQMSQLDSTIECENFPNGTVQKNVQNVLMGQYKRVCKCNIT